MFFGFTGQMYWRDHPPPHVHVLWAAAETLIAIETGAVIAAGLPPAALRLILPWIEDIRAELFANWEHARKLEKLEQVPGADA